MIDEICPVQFIEGINQYAEYDTKNFLDTQSYLSIAIEYRPKFTYCLAQIEILAGYIAVLGVGEFEVALYPDYEGKPGNIILSRGTLAIDISEEVARMQSGRIYDWQTVEFNPVVVIRDNKYWIVINPEGKKLTLCTAVAGEPTNMMIRDEGQWRTDQIFVFGSWQCMLRFYGKILPVSSC